MIGICRERLSTQDIVLQLSHVIITPSDSLDTAALLAQNLATAFTNVTHAAIR